MDRMSPRFKRKMKIKKNRMQPTPVIEKTSTQKLQKSSVKKNKSSTKKVTKQNPVKKR